MVVLITILIVAVITLSIILIYKMGTEANQTGRNDEKLQNNDVKVSYTFEQSENTGYIMGKRNFSVMVNGIKCNNIESKNIQIDNDSNESNLKVYDLKYIKDDTHANEYILLGLYGYLPTSETITYYVIDSSAKVIGKFECTNATTFMLDNKTLKMEFNEDNVIDYKFYEESANSGDVAKHKYTIKDGKIIDTIVDVYDKSKVVIAGAGI